MSVDTNMTAMIIPTVNPVTPSPPPSPPPSQGCQHVCDASGEAPVPLTSSGDKEEAEAAGADPVRPDRGPGERYESHHT